MKFTKFFKILNKKIEQYDKKYPNFFEKPQPVIVIWVEEYSEKKDY